MRKYKIKERAFALILVLCMVFTMMPIDADAASKGDIVDGGMGMTDINYDDKITWPIEIYDYSNDGMLFEYASYTGNGASWAQLDKNEEYCYIPEFTADYYADYTTDEINTTYVADRWFDVWGITPTQSQSSASGQKYYTFDGSTTFGTELIDLRDPNSDSEIECYGATVDEDGNYTFENAYGYTFIMIDSGDTGIINTGDVLLIKDSDSFSTCGAGWSITVELKPTETENQYSVVKYTVGTGTTDDGELATDPNVDFANGNIAMVIHGSGWKPSETSTNWMDRVAAKALKEGDTVTISSNEKYVTVNETSNETSNETKSGVVSKDKVNYATLVYRTSEVLNYETKECTLNYANRLYYSSGTADASGIYVVAGSSSTDTPYTTANDDFGYWYGFLFEYVSTDDSSNEVYKVVATDVDINGTNTVASATIGTNRIAVFFHDTAMSGTYKETTEYLLKYAQVGNLFTLSGTTISTLQGYVTSTSYATALSGVSLNYSVPVEESGTMYAYLRAPGSEDQAFGAAAEVLLSGENATSDWRYCVLDLTKLYSGSNEVSIEEVQGAGITLSSTNAYDLCISHFALFETEDEAEIYGEKALVYNKHYIQTLYPNNATYSADYTTSEIANSTELESYWFTNAINDTISTEVNTLDSYSISTDDNNRQYYAFDFTNDTTTANEIELIDFNNIGGVESSKLKYAVLVANSANIDLTKYSVYFRGESSGTAYGEKKYGKTTKSAYASASSFALVFDLTDISLDEVYSAGVKLDGYAVDWSASDYPTSGSDNTGSYYIYQFAFFESLDEANDYAEQIQIYNQYSEVPTSYYNPIYDNLGYGLLAQSREGDLYDKEERRLGYNYQLVEAYNGSEETYAGLDDMIYYMYALYDDDEEVYEEFDLSTLDFEGYTLYATLKEGAFTAGLVDGTLGSDGTPVYRDKVVDYLANLLATTLVIPEYKGGYFNYDFIRGEKSTAYADENGESRDLASAIRECVGIDFETNDTTPELGDLESTEAKSANLKGTWAECEKYIETCFDAAYYLLNNLFVEGSYNEPQDTYHYLELNKATLSDGKEAYVFDAGLSTDDGESALDYGVKTAKTIGYVDATKKALYYTSTTTTTTLFPFLPVTDENTEEGMTKSPYFADPGVGYDGLYGETYYERDFNYVIKSHGEFVYHEEDGLFFDFEGDDDVYLFINGQLVLDIGGAHSIMKESVNINDYVYAGTLDLQEGEVCTFDFFYMERHGYGANCRIATNLRVTDPSLDVDKTAYQNDAEVIYGGVVDASTPIEYNFSVTNTGNTKLFNIAFDDPFIGVSIDAENGLQTYKIVDGQKVYDTEVENEEDKVNGNNIFGKNESAFSSLDPTELTAVVSGYKKLEEATGNYDLDENGNIVEVEAGTGYYESSVITVTFADNEALKAFMATLDDGDAEGGTESGGSDTSSTGSGAGLWVYSTLAIKGIYYKLTETQKDNGYFNNTVYVTATTMADAKDEGCETLYSSDMHRVYVPSQPYYFQWSDNNIVILKSKLVEDIVNAKDSSGNPLYGDSIYEKDEDGNLITSTTDFTEENINKIELTTANGQSLSSNVVTIDDDNNITVNYHYTGSHVFYLKITYNTDKTLMVPVVVNVLDVEDSYMVLDYGLSVELTNKEGIFKYDAVAVPDHETEVHVMAIAGEDINPYYTSSFDNQLGTHKMKFDADKLEENNSSVTIEATDGDFILNRKGDHEYALTYTPNDFMDGMDSIYAAVAVHDTESEGYVPAGLNGEIDISKEVQMYKKISVLPANVVYYEDDFPAITYTDEEGNILTQGNTFTKIGDGSSTLTQSADQEQEYGKDAAYQTNAEMSGNSLTKIQIGAAGVAAYFDFKGTGFELISRTNAYDSAKFSVKVKALSCGDDGTVVEGDTVKNIPVVTEFDNNADGGEDEIYQVPVIRVDDLTYGTYRVYISGVPTKYYTKENGVYVDPDGNPTADGKPYVYTTYLYVDGLRIYQPYAEVTETETTDEETGETTTTQTISPGQSEHYNASENGAVFEEIRELIVNGQAAVATYDEDALKVSTGTITWTENRNNVSYDGSVFEGNKVTSVNDYLTLGPNNEVYMEKDDASALVFYVNETGIGAHNLQIAFRGIDSGLFYGSTSVGVNAGISYGVELNGEFCWTEAITTNTATEQYYTIDYTKCPYVTGKGYQVVIKVGSGMISYSSLKYNGLTIMNMDGEEEGEAPTFIYVNGVLTENSSGEAVDDSIYPAFSTLRMQFIAKDTVGFDEIEGNVSETPDEMIRYQTRNDKDVRLIAYVGELGDYASVSFTITIGEKTSKELVCTTAYKGLYATDSDGNTKLYTTEDVYGEEYKDAYFVTYTINNYLLSKYAGQEVTITATYTTTDGEIITKARTVTIGTEITE